MLQKIMNESNKLEDHIDEPIKKCVVGMTLLGFKPLMGCCGFNYKGEKVPKKHLEKAYLYLDYKNIQDNGLGGKLLQIAAISRWTINPLQGLKFVDFYGDTWSKNHPWSDVNCPHFHETFVLAINSLEKTLVSLKEYFLQKALIEDGNKYYKEEVSKYWQYDPTESWEVTPEIFEKL